MDISPPTEENVGIKNFLRGEMSRIRIYMLVLDALTKDENADRQLIKLRHPQTNELAIFVYSENDKTLAQMRSLPFSHR